MKIKLVDGTIYDVTDLRIESDVLYIEFENKTAEEVKTILTNAANLKTITLLEEVSEADLAYYEGFTIFSGVLLDSENKVTGMNSHEKDKTLTRINSAEATAVEAKALATQANEAVSAATELTNEIAQPVMLSKQVSSIVAQDFSDEDAATVKYIYPTYTESIGKTVQQNYKMVHEDILYKVIQPTLEITAERIPGSQGMESLYAVIDEKHAGTQEDPIPYSGNMELEANKYYTQNGVLYKCTRGTGQPVYHQLSDLVGLYVEVV